MKDLSTLCYIQEQSSSPEDYLTKFGYEYHDKGNRFFVVFEAVLQSFGVLNRNKRLYVQSNVWNVIQADDQLQTLIRQNSWTGELDHPTSELQGSDLTIQRISIPSKKLSSHYIRKPRLNGNLMEATVQTDSGTEHGMNMAISIVDGKIVPAFSARILGKLDTSTGKPIVNVRKLITYDWVLYPSHSDALGKLNQPIMESTEFQESVDVIEDTGVKILFLKELAQMAAHSSKETEWLCESFGLTIDDIIGVSDTGKSIVIKENTNIYVQPISDKSIRKKTQSTVAGWLNR